MKVQMVIGNPDKIASPLPDSYRDLGSQIWIPKQISVRKFQYKMNLEVRLWEEPLSEAANFGRSNKHQRNYEKRMKAWVYITTNKPDGVLYVGVTCELKNRIISHKTKKYKNSFSARYNVDKLVYFEKFDSIMIARKREKQIKAGSRVKKIKLIISMNAEWKDLYDELN